MSFIEDQLNTYMKLKSGVQSDRVEISDIVKQNGSLAIPNNHIGITLVNIEEEVYAKTQGKVQQSNGSQLVKVNPDIKVNLYLLFSANFSEYSEALKAISHLLTFFQSRNVFENSQYPALDPSIEKLIVELQSLSFEQLNHLWGTVGAKYLPSVLYKMRMLVIHEAEIDKFSYPIREIRIDKRGVM